MEHKKKLSIIILLFLFAPALSGLYLWNNIDSLFSLSLAFDEPSRPFYLILNRIYCIISEDSKYKQFLGKLYYNSDNEFDNLYLRVIGVSGYKRSLDRLKSIFLSSHNKSEYRSTLYYVIVSIGLIGDIDAVPFLEKLLIHFDENEYVIQESNIVTALYLITGDVTYRFKNSFGEEQSLLLTDRLRNARRIIVSSKNRKRTHREMIILDHIFRPPDDRMN